MKIKPERKVEATADKEKTPTEKRQSSLPEGKTSSKRELKNNISNGKKLMKVSVRSEEMNIVKKNEGLRWIQTDGRSIHWFQALLDRS